MIDSRKGHAIVELAFLFPLLTLLFLSTLDLILLAIAQSQWEKHVAQTARTLSLTCGEEFLDVEMKRPWKTLFLKRPVELTAFVREVCHER